MLSGLGFRYGNPRHCLQPPKVLFPAIDAQGFRDVMVAARWILGL